MYHRPVAIFHLSLLVMVLALSGVHCNGASQNDGNIEPIDNPAESKDNATFEVNIDIPSEGKQNNNTPGEIDPTLTDPLYLSESPGVTINPALPKTVQPPANCKDQCMLLNQEAGSEKCTETDEECKKSCDELCQPFDFKPNPNVLKTIVQPKSATVKYQAQVAFCNSLAYTMTFSQGMISLTKVEMGGAPVIVSEKVPDHLRQSVMVAASTGWDGDVCPEKLIRTAIVYVDGKEYAWVNPHANPFNMNYILEEKCSRNSIKWVLFKGVAGPGAHIPEYSAVDPRITPGNTPDFPFLYRLNTHHIWWYDPATVVEVEYSCDPKEEDGS